MRSDREQDLMRTVRYRRAERGEGAHDPARTKTAVASAPAAPAGRLGATLGRYWLERKLGTGAMGVVHAAFDPDLHRQSALKVLRGVNVTPGARERLLRGARAMARLAHPQRGHRVRGRHRERS